MIFFWFRPKRTTKRDLNHGMSTHLLLEATHKPIRHCSIQEKSVPIKYFTFLFLLIIWHRKRQGFLNILHRTSLICKGISADIKEITVTKHCFYVACTQNEVYVGNFKFIHLKNCNLKVICWRPLAFVCIKHLYTLLGCKWVLSVLHVSSILAQTVSKRTSQVPPFMQCSLLLKFSMIALLWQVQRKVGDKVYKAEKASRQFRNTYRLSLDIFGERKRWLQRWSSPWSQLWLYKKGELYEWLAW